MGLIPNPSSAPIWGACSASLVALSEQVKEDKTLDQLEGLAAHEFLENTLLGEIISAGETSSHGVPFSEEMIEAADELLRVIEHHNKELDVTRDIKPFLVEHYVGIPSVHENCVGRLDAGRVDPANKVVYVFEYKYGHGFVDEYFNFSGVLLAEGLRIENDISLADWPDWRVHYTLGQPRCFDPRAKGQKIRTHTYSGTEHSEQVAFLKAMVLEAELQPTETPNSQCSKCPAVLSCSALRATTALICDISLRLGDKQDPSFSEMEQELVFLEDAERRLSARKTFLSAAVQGCLTSGDLGRHFRLERGATIRVFDKSSEELKELQDLFKTEGGESPRFLAEPKPLTFLQAKALPENQALVAGGFFDEISKEVYGKVSLKRINHDDAKRAFTKGSK